MTNPTEPASIRAWGLSWLRTAVPTVWGFVLGANTAPVYPGAVEQVR